MVKPNIENNIELLHARLAQLATVGPFVRGSVVRLGPHQKPMLSLNKDRKTRLVYLGESRLDQALEYSQNYKRVLALIEEITTLVMELLREGVPPHLIWPAAPRKARKRPHNTRTETL